jgi:ABC-type transport system involved in multi-copper enzyme maturation permease subunit
MRSVINIARLTFSEALRNKIMYAVLAFLILMLLATSALASVTMGRTELMVLDLGMGGISILANLMAIVITIQSLQQEKESRTLYVLLTRLSNRWQYIVGKFLGLAMVLGGLVLLMCALLTALIYLFGSVYPLSLLEACLSMLLETWLVIAVAMLFAQTSSLFLAILLTLCVDISGRFTTVIYQFGQQSDASSLRILTEIMYYTLPNLETVNLRNSAGYISSYGTEMLVHVFTYGFIEISFLLILAAYIFEKRNLS